MSNFARPRAAADPPLLGYTVTTAPDPIQVSTASAPATAVISASVAPLGGQPVYCNQITIYVYVGTDEQALSADQPASGVNRGSWAPSESGIKSAEALGLPGTADDNYYYATYGCSVPADFDIDYLLIFTLQATVNTVPGPFTLNFEETSAMTSDPSSFTPRDTAVPMTKADSVFYLDNFIATAAGTPAVPASEFANGAANQIVFSWASNGTGYTLFAGMPATQIYTGQATTFTLPAGASVDTTYTLQAEQVSGGAPAEYLYRTLTLTVANPDLTPNSVVAAGAVSAASLAISGTAGVSGALTASGGAAVTGGLTTDTLTASGTAVLSGQTSLNGAATASAGMTVNGGLAADNLTVGNSLSTGTASVSGQLSLPGSSHMISGATAVAFSSTAATWYTANTDGFLVAFVSWDSASGSAHNTTRMSLYSGTLGQWLVATGGNHCAQIYGDCSWWMGGYTGAVNVPVQAGTQFGVQQLLDPNNDDNSAACYCWFVPLGAATPFASAIEAAETPADVPPQPVPHSQAGKQSGGASGACAGPASEGGQVAAPAGGTHNRDREEKISNFLDAFAGTFPWPGARRRRERLAQAVLKLVDPAA